MDLKNNEIKEIYRSMKIMYVGIVLGVIGFFAITLYLNVVMLLSLTDDKDLKNILNMVSVLSMLSLIPLAFYLYKKKLSAISSELPFIERIVLYKKTYLIKIVLLDACCFLCIGFFFISNNQYILYSVLISIIALLMSYPNKTTLISDLKTESENSVD